MAHFGDSKTEMPKPSLTEQVEGFYNAPYSIVRETSQGLLSVEDYRQILNDYNTPDTQIQKRLQYLEAFCRNIARQELNGLGANNG